MQRSMRLAGAVIDITGSSFGGWTVLAYLGSLGKAARFLCRCDCGEVRVLAGNRLRQHAGTECTGRHANDGVVASHLHTSGGASGTYRSWQAMRGRCERPSNAAWPRYGGRGIRVCDEWRRFDRFLFDMGPRPDGAWIERIDNDGPYCLANCRWSTPSENSRNRSNTKLVEYRGESRPLIAWCEMLDLDYASVNVRMNRGWTADRAFATPTRRRFAGSYGQLAAEV